MLHMCDENHRPFFLVQTFAIGQSTAKPQSKDSLHFIDNCCHSETRQDDDIIRSRITVLLDDFLSMMVCPCHPRARLATLRMRVPDEWSEALHDGFLDRLVQPTAGNPIGIEQFLTSERSGELKFVTYDVRTKGGEMLFDVHSWFWQERDWQS